MKFLAINTAGSGVEAALYIDGVTVFESDSEFRKASAVLLPFIDKLLSGANLTLKELDFIAVVTGPGSFTGIRIGLSAARAFAQFTGVRLVPVTYAEVLAYNTTETNRAETIVTVSDAANGFAYIAAFDEKMRFVLPPEVLKTAQVKKFLDTVDESCAVCFDGAAEALVADSGKTTVKPKTDCTALIRAALYAFQARGAVPYAQVAPLYVRQSQAEINLAESK